MRHSICQNDSSSVPKLYSAFNAERNKKGRARIALGKELVDARFELDEVGLGADVIVHAHAVEAIPEELVQDPKDMDI